MAASRAVVLGMMALGLLLCAGPGGRGHAQLTVTPPPGAPPTRELGAAPTPDLPNARLGEILTYPDELGGRHACIVTEATPGNVQFDCRGSGIPGPQGPEGPPGPPGEPGNPGTGLGGLIDVKPCGDPNPTLVLRSSTDPTVRVIPCTRADVGGIAWQVYPADSVGYLERPMVLASDSRTVGSTFTLDPADFAAEASGLLVRPRLLLTCTTAADCTGTLVGDSNAPEGMEIELYNAGVEGNDLLLPDVADVYDGPGTSVTLAAGERVLLIRRPGGLWTGHGGSGGGSGLIGTDDLADSAVTPEKIQGLGDASDSTHPVSFASLMDVRSPQTVTAATDQLDCGTREGITLLPLTADADYTLSSNPQLVAGRVGQLCLLVGTHATNLVTLVDGNGVEHQSDGNHTLGLLTAQAYYYTGSVWRQLALNTAFGCQWVWNAGSPALTCGATDVTLTPGQATGNVVLTDAAGAACLTVDPDTGALTQGTNCQTLTASHALAVAAEAYDATGWNGDTTVPQKDAVRDKIEALPKAVDWHSFPSNEIDGTAYLRLNASNLAASAAESFANENFGIQGRAGIVRYLACRRAAATGGGNTITYTARVEGTTTTDAVCTMANASSCLVTAGTTAISANNLISIIKQETAGTPGETEIVCNVGVEVTP